MSALRSTVADVDLDAIAHNLAAVARGVTAIAVVKADAYGHGVEVTARALVDAGAAMLAVFTVEEGVVLRRSGIDAPVLVLGGLSDPTEADAAVAHRLAVAVWDEAVARALGGAARAANATAHVHVKVDTGLTRLGAPLDEAITRYGQVAATAGVAIDGVFTHLANADLPGDRTAAEQVEGFGALVAALAEPPPLIHAANSAGAVLLGVSAPCNAVRPGIALYGIHAAPHLATIDLRPALRWSSRIQRIAAVPAGTGVGYGHEYRLPRDGRVATVPVGYGDGLRRDARHASVLVRGQRVPIAGRVAMDLIALDVTELPEAREGDEVVITGEQDGARLPIEDLAQACGTNTYEVLTAIRRMVPRRYLRGGRCVALRTLADGVRWSD